MTGGALTIAQALAREHNAFGAVRLALAVAVVVSHAFSVTSGIVGDEPLAASTGFTLGEHAVSGFFAVSGFLVTMSLARRGPRDYAIARILRILPGLIAATLVVSLGRGTGMTTLPAGAYWHDPSLWRFVTATLTAFKSTAALPGVFADNPLRFPMGTVWTLKYEVLCYLGLLGAGLMGALRHRWPALVLVAGLALALAGLGWLRPEADKGLETALRLPMIFAAGAALYLWRETVRLAAWPLAGLVLAALVRGTPLYRPLLFLAESYAALWLALAPALARAALDPPADLSYGVYLYGWPIQQTLHALAPSASAVALLAPSVVLSLTVATLSWYAIEKSALALKARTLGRRALGAIESAGP